MQRRYFVRHKEVNIEEIEGVVAVRADPHAPIDAQRQLEVMRTSLPMESVDTAALKPFERANWRFVPRNEAMRSALATHRALAGSDAVGRLFRRANGSLAIGTNRLTVQLDPQLSEAQSQAALSEHSLEVVRALGFGNNLYEVLARSHRDSIEASETLQGDPRFLLAEPVFLDTSIVARVLPILVMRCNGSSRTPAKAAACPVPMCMPRKPGSSRVGPASVSPSSTTASRPRTRIWLGPLTRCLAISSTP